MNDVIQKTEFVERLLEEMKACDLGENGGIKSRLNEIQKIVNDFDLENMSNLPQWVSDLNVKIENVLAKRLEGLMD